jgi:hypothetical protein
MDGAECVTITDSPLSRDPVAQYEGVSPEDPNYVQEAAARGMNAFNTPNFAYSILNATGNGWTANQAFLNAGIASGQSFYYSSAPYITGGFGYLSEILYLAGQGVLTVPLP